MSNRARARATRPRSPPRAGTVPVLFPLTQARTHPVLGPARSPADEVVLCPLPRAVYSLLGTLIKFYRKTPLITPPVAAVLRFRPRAALQHDLVGRRRPRLGELVARLFCASIFACSFSSAERARPFDSARLTFAGRLSSSAPPPPPPPAARRPRPGRRWRGDAADLAERGVRHRRPQLLLARRQQLRLPLEVEVVRRVVVSLSAAPPPRWRRRRPPRRRPAARAAPCATPAPAPRGGAPSKRRARQSA